VRILYCKRDSMVHTLHGIHVLPTKMSSVEQCGFLQKLFWCKCAELFVCKEAFNIELGYFVVYSIYLFQYLPKLCG
jgi:hypothetical protein